MAFDPGAVGRAFSEHRFDEALGHLAKNVRWTIVGYMVLEGAEQHLRNLLNLKSKVAYTETSATLTERKRVRRSVEALVEAARRTSTTSGRHTP